MAKPKKRKRTPILGKLVTLTVGDWSNDGHGRTHRVTLRTNLSRPEIEAAYRKGCEIIGYDFEEKVARDYEDSVLSRARLEQLIGLGLDTKEIFGCGVDELKEGWGDDPSLDYDTYWMIWLFVAKLGAPRLAYKQVLEGSNIHVGGYGCFYG